MKELSIEEKAKRYDEAITRAKVWKEKSGMPADRQGILDDVFPELKESEDERIRTRLINYFSGFYDRFATDRNHTNVRWEGLEVKKVLAWLEKQGEQKSITFNDAHTIDSALNDYCCKQHGALQKENGGVLSFARLQHLAMDIYGWCRKQIEQKHAWSEEDSDMIDDIVKNLKKYQLQMPDYRVELQVRWLKSLRPQNTWKPSDEQMADLWNMVCECRPADQQLLQDIYYGLKTLRGE